MKSWNPKHVPHTNHPVFGIDFPFQAGKIDLGRGPLTYEELHHPNELVSRWAEACEEALEVVNYYNRMLRKYKDADPTGGNSGGPVADDYKLAVTAVHYFISEGYKKYLEEDTFIMEVVESDGFVISVRIAGRVLEKVLKHSHSSSSSHFSMYSPS